MPAAFYYAEYDENDRDQQSLLVGNCKPCLRLVGQSLSPRMLEELERRETEDLLILSIAPKGVQSYDSRY